MDIKGNFNLVPCDFMTQILISEKHFSCRFACFFINKLIDMNRFWFPAFRA